MARCAEEEPMLTDVEGRLVACHLYDGDARRGRVRLGAGAEREEGVSQVS
jgi:hypothetical protein